MGRYRAHTYGYIYIEYNYNEKMIYLKDEFNSFRCKLSKNKLDDFASVLILLGDMLDDTDDHHYIYFGADGSNEFDRNQTDFINSYRVGGKIIGNYFNIFRRYEMLFALKSFFRRKKFELILPDDMTKIPLKMLIQMRNKKCQLLELKS